MNSLFFRERVIKDESKNFNAANSENAFSNFSMASEATLNYNWEEMKKKIVQFISFVDNVKNTRKIKKKKKNRFQYFPDNMLWSCGLKATEHLLLTK